SLIGAVAVEWNCSAGHLEKSITHKTPMLRRTFTYPLLCIFFLFFAQINVAQTVSNGSVTGAPTANSGINAGNAPPWTQCFFSPDLCDVGFPSYSGNTSVTPAPSPDGGTWLGMCGNGECSQTTITGLTPGNSYTLYFCGANFGTGSFCTGSPATPQVTIGTSVVTFSIPQAANTWNPYSVPFMANAATMTLEVRHSSNGYASLDGFNLSGTQCNPVPLPVTVESFEGNAMDCAIMLSWRIPESVEFQRFDVMRSADGGEFTKIGDVFAEAGTLSYQFEDRFPTKEGHYQLKMFDRDGSFAETDVLPVPSRCGIPHLEILPNPASPGLGTGLRFYSFSDANVLRAVDLQGKLVWETKVDTKADDWNYLGLDLTDWAPGVYVISSSDGGRGRLVVRE
ncbi:MAG: hypothetical protein AAF570_18255, partial [Bacteroidota bacterium]